MKIELNKALIASQTPSYKGYDIALVRRPGKDGLTISDFNLLFGSTTCDENVTYHPENVLRNVDHTLFKVYNQALDQAQKIETYIKENAERTEKKVTPVNGKVIKATILDLDSKEYIEVKEIDGYTLEEVNAITQKMFDMQNCIGQKLTVKHREVDEEFSKGLLDVAKQGTRTYLVRYNSETDIKEITDRVPGKLLKETLFYLANLHYGCKAFKEKLNVEHTEGNYKLTVKNGLQYWDKLEGDWTKLETDIIEDLKKIV